MKDNAMHIKIVFTNKANPHNEGDLKEITRVIETGPIGIVGRKHSIVANADAITKDGLQKEKEINSLKKESTPRID